MGRAQIIAGAIERSWIFEDAKVPLYLALIKTISIWDWMASDLGKREALVNKAKGISPFALIDIFEEDIAVITQHNKDLQLATAVSDTEVRTARENVTYHTPASAEKFIMILKQYANLLQTLFIRQYPLYKQMYVIIKTLRGVFTHCKGAAIA